MLIGPAGSVIAGQSDSNKTGKGKEKSIFRSAASSARKPPWSTQLFRSKKVGTSDTDTSVAAPSSVADGRPNTHRTDG